MIRGPDDALEALAKFDERVRRHRAQLFGGLTVEERSRAERVARHRDARLAPRQASRARCAGRTAESYFSRFPIVFVHGATIAPIPAA